MKNQNEKYADKVVSKIPVDKKYKARIKEDILSRLSEVDDGLSPEELMGAPKTVAQEFMENIDPSVLKTDFEKGYRYTSDNQIMGLPIIDIQYKTGKAAKGVIAIGDIAIGLIAIGGISFGVLSLGGVGIGLLAFGGMAIGALSAMGGLAVAYGLALGGLAVAHDVAIGGVAYAVDIAIGDVTRANVSAYISEFEGNLGFEKGVVPFSEFKNQLSVQYPNLSSLMLKIIEIAYKA